jgi:MoaA/NifB/PqqE/SkfB family radical SAM enzyme
MTNTFCRLLSNQLRVEYNKLTPCCWFKTRVDINDPSAVEKYKKRLLSIADWEHTNGDCDECLHREVTGQPSPREQSLNRLHYKDADVGKIVRLEIQIDSDCNAACLICGPWNSTTWEKYNNKLKGIPVQNIGYSQEDIDSSIESINKNFNLNNLREILFLGGEPLRTDNHLKILNTIRNPENIILNYTTNGSYKPNDKTLEMWSKFKRVILTFSIDGIGKQFEYLRWPLNWQQVEENLKYILELKNSNIRFSRISYTTTPFSLYYHDTYVDWGRTFFANTYVDITQIFDMPWQPRGDTEMELSAVPENLAQIIKEKYGAEHNITKLLVPFNIEKYKKFKKYIEYHDKNRGQNWQEVFPEMIPYFAK